MKEAGSLNSLETMCFNGSVFEGIAAKVQVLAPAMACVYQRHPYTGFGLLACECSASAFLDRLRRAMLKGSVGGNEGNSNFEVWKSLPVRLHSNCRFPSLKSMAFGSDESCAD